MEQAIDKLPLTSMNLRQHQLDGLKALFPEVFDEGKIDWDRLRLTLGEVVDTSEERYTTIWPGKSQCFRTIQEPSIGTLKPCENESINWESAKDLFIEGDNLEVLKLLQQAYHNKIKMIYIDPPYNTGNDFIYPDNYAQPLQAYLSLTGQVDNAGRKLTSNLESSGRFHSSWMNMMYPRLFLARNLLRTDGVIFISINDVELKNLMVIMNEIFGEENFVANLVWTNKEGGSGSDSQFFRVKHEYILCYAKDIDALSINGTEIANVERYTLSDEYETVRGRHYSQKLGMASIRYSQSLDYAIETPDGSVVFPSSEGEGACWRWSRKKYEWGLENGFIAFKQDTQGNWHVYTKQYLNCDNDGNIIERKNRPFGVIDKYSSIQATKALQNLLGDKLFSYPKPVELIAHLIGLATIKNENDIVLDFFGGSGTTAEAVISKNQEDGGNRQYIVIQFPELLKKDSRAFQRGCKNLADLCRFRIHKVIQNQKKDSYAGVRAFMLTPSNFKVWNAACIQNGEDLAAYLDAFTDPIVDASSDEDILFEILIKSGFELNVPIEKMILAGKIIYAIGHNTFIICLERQITEALILEVALRKPTGFVCLDLAFSGNDQLKTNAIQIMKSYGIIDFRTI